MRTYIGTLVTLYTIFRLPFGDIDCYSTFFIGCSPCRESTILPACKSTYRKIVTFEVIYGFGNITYKVGNIAGILFFLHFYGSPFGRYFNLLDLTTFINSCKVHFNDLFAFSSIGFLDGFFHLFFSLFIRYYVCYFKEGSLHYRVGPRPQSYIFGNFCCIDNIEVNLILCQIFLYMAGKSVFCLFCIPYGIKKECTSFFQTLQHIIFIEV